MEQRAAMPAEQLAALLDRKRARTTEEEVAVLAASDGLLARRFEQKPCSFFAKGHCTRGAACPYRHVLPPRTEDQVRGGSSAAAAAAPSASASIRDRFAAGPAAAATSAGGSGTAGILAIEGAKGGTQIAGGEDAALRTLAAQAAATRPAAVASATAAKTAPKEPASFDFGFMDDDD
jgi:hypothetical protein